MKDYLNKFETNQFMVMNSVLQSVLGINNIGTDGPKLKTMREEWAKRGNLTKEEHKSLKMAETYMGKFIMSVHDRLSPKQQEQINKKLFKYAFQLVDDYSFQKMSRDAQDKIQNAVMPRQEFYDWCAEIMEVKCNGCTKDWNTCDLHQVFDNNFVPESGFDCSNCKFAYSDLREE
jgi:polyhydroxyalkanoate synthesis regulator phasin